MKAYIKLVTDILTNGVIHEDRTMLFRKSIFGHISRYNLREGFPIPTTRYIPFHVVAEETLWFLRGSTNNQELNDVNVKIWNPWVVRESDVDKIINRYIPDHPEEGKKIFKESLLTEYKQQIGPMYGHIWRNAPATEYSPLFPKVTEKDIASDKLALYKKEYDDKDIMYESFAESTENQTGSKVEFSDYINYRHYQTIDQMQNLIVNLRERPHSARHVVTSLIPEFVPFEFMSPQENILLGKGCLAPCHVLQQYFVLPPEKEGDKPRLCLMMTQRSVDIMVGANFNIAGYSLLLSMIAHVVNMEPYEFIYSTGDTHIYLPHIENAIKQIEREPYPLPKLWLNPSVKDLFAFTMNDIRLSDYKYHPGIDYVIAI